MILIIEDDPAINSLLCGILEKNGYEAEFVASLAQKQVNHGAIDLAGGFYWLTTCLIVLPGTAILYAGFKIKGRN